MMSLPKQSFWRSTRALVISLRRCSSRAAHVQSILDTCPIPCDIWDATDGSQLSQEQIDDCYAPRLMRPNYPFKLRLGEIGCFFSHRSIWQKMVDESIDRLLIIEDDVTFLPNFAESLAYAITHATDISYVQFQVRNLKFPGHSEIDQLHPKLIRPTLVPLRTSAQLVSLGAARRLLEFSKQFDRPVDAAIQMTWEHGVEVLVAVPQRVAEISALIGGSTIANSQKKRKPIWETIRREWERTRYRQSIAKCSSQYLQLQLQMHSKTNQKIA